MRVTFLLPVVAMAGGIKVVGIYANALVKKGHTVVLISPPAPVPSLVRKIKNFLRLRGWPQKPPKVQSHLDLYNLDHRVLDMWRPIADADVPDGDVVVATWWETAEWMMQLDARKGVKTYFVQGHEIFENLPVQRVKATYKFPVRRITISTWLNNILRDLYDDYAADVVLNGVDHAQFFSGPRSKQKQPTVGFLYSGARIKGADAVLQVLNSLKRRIPNLRVVSFGAISPTLSNWDNEIQFELSPHPDRLREVYAQCDLWLSASRSEGFNLTAMEAMACRTPIVSTLTGWPVEAIRHKENGMLANIDAIDDLVEACAWVLGLSAAEWLNLSDQAFETVKNASWDVSSTEFEAALFRAIRV